MQHRNQRPPNSLHHDNALPSDLFDQPCGSKWHSRHECTTRHIPAPEELDPLRKRRQFIRSRRDDKGGSAEKKRTLRLPLSSLLVEKTHPTALEHLPHTRAKPLPQRQLLTSALYPKTSMYRKIPEQSTCAL